MFRAIASVVVGLVVLVVWVMATDLLWVLVAPETWRDSIALWSVISIVLGFVGAILAGFVTAAIAVRPSRAPVKVLAGIILVLGLSSAVFYLFADGPVTEPSAPAGDMTAVANTDAVTAPPTWYNFSIPVVGCVGVLIGGGLRRRPAVTAPTVTAD